MSRDAECIVCNAGRPNLQAICTDCDGCMVEHCQCDPCAHGKVRSEDCGFCGRLTPLLEAIVRADDIESDIRWLIAQGPL